MPSIPIAKNVQDATDFPEPPGWGHIGRNFLGRITNKLGVVRLMDPGLYEYAKYSGSPWKMNPDNKTQFFIPLPSDNISGFGSLGTLAIQLQSQVKAGESFEKPTRELLLLAAVIQQLLIKLADLEKAGVRVRLLDPTNVIYWSDSNKPPSADDVCVWLPDVGFEFIGVPRPGDVPPFLDGAKRWGKFKPNVAFDKLWPHRSLWDVNRGLSPAEEKAGVARMLGWVMDGEIRETIPAVNHSDDEAKEFWNDHPGSAWRELARVLGPGAIRNDASPQDFYQRLSKNAVIAQHFRTTPQVPDKSQSGRPWLLIAGVLLIALCVAGWYFQDPIRAWLQPPPAQQPYAVCPECTKQASPELFAHLGKLQSSLDELNQFEQKLIARDRRFPEEELQAKTGLVKPPIEPTQALVLADMKAYLETLAICCDLLEKAQAAVAEQSRDKDCLEGIAAALEAHLYQVADSFKALQSTDIGVGEAQDIQLKLEDLAKTLGKFLTLSSRTRNSLGEGS